MYNFDAEKTMNECVEWIRDFFRKNGPDSPAVIGISGGKDSTVTAALCVAALGCDRVIGVLMPNGVQADINDSIAVVEHLKIKNFTIDIKDAVSAILKEMEDKGIPISDQSRINLPPRIRMSTLYAVSQSHNGRVANTCNLSEDWVGYSTRYGDAAGDFSPLAHLTVTEVKEIGRLLKLPSFLVDKAPSDGLCGKTDEDNLGFRYATLDKYIREGVIESEADKAIIDKKHVQNLFKLQVMPGFSSGLPEIPQV
ncbi:MAG: NAD(+) synthase [Lachnospiraceae bacterium]|nr:NAD(+) synthase [Lachnospiraceae bacterium]